MGLPTLSKHLFLIGPRGSGKSAVGAHLSNIFHMDFLDADPYLESKFQRRIPDIFREDGEAKFREMETATLKEISVSPPKVIATGGGVILAETNRTLLKQYGFCVWLKTSEEILLERLWNDQMQGIDRPALTNQKVSGQKESLKSEIQTVLKNRKPLYELTADLIIETDSRKPQEIAGVIAASIERKLEAQ